MAVVSFAVYVICLVFALGHANTVNAAMGRHLICKNVGEVFLDHGAEFSADSSAEGVMQKRGAAGRTGARGPRGPPGVVDYGVINETMGVLVQEATKDLKERLKALELFTDRVKEGLCQVQYDGKCYWVIFSTVNFFEGQSMCRSFGGKVANIYDKRHFDLITNYIRYGMPGSASYIEPWLGMNLDTTTGMVMTSDGATAPYLSWFPGYPRTGHVYAAHTKVNLQVRKDVTSSTQGMWNYDPSEPRDGVLCEF